MSCDWSSWALALAVLGGMLLQSILLIGWGVVMDSNDPGRDV